MGRFRKHLAEKTNSYAEQEWIRDPSHTNTPKWTPADPATLKAFIGLVFCMGIIRLPHRHDYWRQMEAEKAFI